MNETFDFIVTGAGSAGCAVAARLAELGGYSVLLLEAGPKDNYPWIHVPLGFTKVFVDERVNWKFQSEPVEALNGRTLYQPRGKVLGGTSSINGTVYMRGTPTDYDHWRQLGCDGWGWESVLPMFKRAQNQTRGADDFHGTGGPLTVSDIPTEWPLPAAFIDAAVQAGIPRNVDFNGAVQEGTGFYQFTATQHQRMSAAKAYLRNAKLRDKLKIETNAHALRVLVSDGRATGVEYATPDGIRQAMAKYEVVVSGGAFGSPQLLELSGIGDGELLRQHGVTTNHHLPGVGRNLHDHFNTYISFRTAQTITLNDLANSAVRRVMAGIQYVATQSGPLSNTGVCAGAMVRTDDRLEQPDLQINMLAWSTAERRADQIIPHPFSAFSLSPVHLRPEGRGSVHIKSADPRAHPAIQFEFLVSDYDKQAIITGMRLCRKIAAQPALKPYVVEEVMPGAAVESDAALLEDIRERAIANYHPVGTCAMGTHPMAVVDPRLRVQGLNGLRVADASIMPQIIAGNTNAPSIMIGEKAASMIIDDHR